MKIKLMSVIDGLLLCGCLLFAGFASADTITTPIVSYGPAVLNWQDNLTLTLDKFDSTLGTLTGITITLAGQVDSTIKIWNESDVPITVTYDLSALISLWYDDLTKIAETIPVINGSSTVAAGGSASATGHGEKTTPTTVSSSYFDEFSEMGGGTLTLFLKGVSGSNVTGTGTYLIGLASLASVNASIEYTYTPPSDPVPEPATMFLFGTGILGILGVGRRIQSKS